ncbi:sensor histidine kinase KdpD [Acetobacter lovaniensis]|uniref:sensor histidine kinase n=1 Tax=Acetobacter lovaniensis TaxID=104100 RepID=UPI0020A1B447|nr:sensor histidine kinase KdpD [Acetobacter lovaniensis]MCP1239194.1 sensor histidine kinase KdpD [Acetobacter lovaniensis]
MDTRLDRPDPDALLRQTSTEGENRARGRLKIFLGAAPGVGKTFQMLTTAHQLQRDGADVLVGIVETHGRSETAALVEGLEVQPRRAIRYRGQTVYEMDLDAILARAPGIVVVDELAHTNAPGSRHPKRWMDVEELLAACIDVLTTVNIQHLESLNDIIASITRIRVRETVPDRVIERADEVELIDLTPNDLLQRMRDGKIYAEHTAGRAMLHYFSPGNLTALRELALRQTAQQVDAQLVDHMKANAIAGPWAAGERIMVCLTLQDGDASLLRYGKRLADRLHAPWSVLHVETSRDLTDTARARMASQMHLAQSLGAETVTIPGQDVALDAVAYARAQNVTQIVAAHPAGRGWSGRVRQWLGRATTERLIQCSQGFPVHVVPRSSTEEVAAERPRDAGSARIGPYVASSLIVMGALGVALLLRRGFEVSNVSLAFLTAILGVAVAYGLWPSLWASLLGMLCFNFFFLPPLYTLTIAAPDNVVALFFFFATALIASNLGARVRNQAVVARHRADITQSLYHFSRTITGIIRLDDLLWSVSHQIATMLECDVVMLLPEHGKLTVKASYNAGKLIGAEDLAAAAWAWKHNRVAGRGSDNLPGVRWLFTPLRTGRGPVAVIGLDTEKDGAILDAEQQRLLDALAEQTASALERILLASELDQARLDAETDKLRGALLTSISHDLRTPLASILGAASSLDSYGDTLDEAARKDLLTTIRDEAERLNRFVANLLDMTRLEAGALHPRTEPVDIVEIIASALTRAARLLVAHQIDMVVEPDLPMLRLDDVLLEQALFNILDNAGKYTPPHTNVTIVASATADQLVVRVLDEGDGFSGSDPEQVFAKFTRFTSADRSRAGTGLGLAITRGFVEAMGGTITARNRRDRPGAEFVMSFPLSMKDAV